MQCFIIFSIIEKLFLEIDLKYSFYIPNVSNEYSFNIHHLNLLYNFN